MTELMEGEAPGINPGRNLRAPARERTPRNFFGFKQLAVARQDEENLDGTAFAVCIECESLILYEPAWPELPKVCRKCFSRRAKE